MISVQHSRGFTRPGQRGIALFLTLLMTGVLVIVVTALLGNARGGSVFSQDFHAKRAAYLAAESGVSVLQQRLSDNPTYNSTVTSEATPFETGSYSYRFNSSNCINNLEGATPAPMVKFPRVRLTLKSRAKPWDIKRLSSACWVEKTATLLQQPQ